MTTEPDGGRFAANAGGENNAVSRHVNRSRERIMVLIVTEWNARESGSLEGEWMVYRSEINQFGIQFISLVKSFTLPPCSVTRPILRFNISRPTYILATIHVIFAGWPCPRTIGHGDHWLPD